MARTKATPVKNSESTDEKKDIKVKKPHRFRSGTVALREIRRYQSSTAQQLPKAPFRRAVNDALTKVATSMQQDTRWKKDAIDALHEAAEIHVVKFFQHCQDAAVFGDRITILPKDVEFVRKNFKF